VYLGQVKLLELHPETVGPVVLGIMVPGKILAVQAAVVAPFVDESGLPIILELA
jgi:hypothetical protein